MKKVLSVLLLACACVLGQSSQSNSAPTAAGPANAAPAATAANTTPEDAKARHLLDQMVDALGGQAWLTYRNIEQQGRGYSFFQGRPNSAGTVYWRYYEYPDKERRELTKQRDVVDIFNGDKGYEKTYKGTAAAEDKSVKEVVRRHQHSLEVVLREWLQDRKTLLFYDGRSLADQQLVDVVTILSKDADQLSIGIDINSHLPISTRYSWRDSDKYKVEDETIFGNYRKVQGIETPYTITNKRDGEMTSQVFLSRVAYNATLAPGFFDAAVTYDPETYNPKAKKK